MIALFVTIETREPGPAPIRTSASCSAASSAARVSASSAAVALRFTSWTSPSTPPSPYQKSPRSPGRASARARAAAARGRARRRRTPRAAPTPAGPTRRCGRGLEPVERRGDHVEVGRLRGVLPAAPDRRRRSTRARRRSSPRPRPARRPRRRGSRPRARRRASSSAAPIRARRGGIAGEQHRLEVGERAGGAVAERDRLLDLEVARHLAVARRRGRTRSARGLRNRSSWPRGGALLARERRRAEAFERALGASARGPSPAAPARAAVGERSMSASACRRAAPRCAR